MSPGRERRGRRSFRPQPNVVGRRRQDGGDGRLAQLGFGVRRLGPADAALSR
ncbi:hypothetical protein ACIODS_07900 [Micromonospora chalcea]|uniref:hypothetical protein n=1 Tax=Micromonospora chalcea TaxID=1874 RepID=UPI0037F82C7D